MDIHQLRLFRDIATELSFVRAAQLNFITQPAVSAQIKRLEQELEVKLFERVPRRVALTNEGKLLLPHVEEILKLCQNLKTISGEAIQQPRGEVRLASIHSIGMYELGPFLRRFLLTFPNIHVRLQYVQAQEVYDLLIRKKVDIGIVAYPNNHSLIDCIPFGEDRMVLIAHPHHPLARRTVVQLAQLDGQPFIAFDEGIPTREAIDSILERAHVQVDIRMTNDNIYAIKSAVQANLGIAFVPLPTVEEEIRLGTLALVNLRLSKIMRPRAIVTRKKRSLPKAASIFLESFYSAE